MEQILASGPSVHSVPARPGWQRVARSVSGKTHPLDSLIPEARFCMTQSAHTHFEHFILHLLHMPLWLRVLLVMMVLGVPFALAYLEGVPSITSTQEWRGAVFPIVGIVYMLAVTPWIWHAERKVVDGLRPLVRENLEPYNTLSSRVWWRSSTGDWVTFAIGFIGGTWLVDFQEWYWVDRYLLFVYLVLYGCATWLIYAATSSARLTALLHRHFRHEDPFDVSCFEPVGRQGLILSLIFIGAITISLPFADIRNFLVYWQNWVIYSILLAATVLLFFLVMWPTHRMLLRVKKQQLARVERLVGQSSAHFQTLTTDQADTHAAATDLQAWLALEQRLKQTRTWPYDTEVLRTLFLSVLTPLFVALARVVGTLLTEGRLGL